MAIFSLIRIAYIFCKHRLDELLDPLENKILFILFLFPRIFFRKRKQIEDRLGDALEEMGPLFIKFGQLLSTRPDLVGDIQASALKKFQNNLSPFSEKEAIKITVRFLSNEVRSDSLKVITHKKTCKSALACNTIILENSAISQELVSSIIKKAALLEKADKEKK